MYVRGRERFSGVPDTPFSFNIMTGASSSASDIVEQDRKGVDRTGAAGKRSDAEREKKK